MTLDRALIVHIAARLGGTLREHGDLSLALAAHIDVLYTRCSVDATVQGRVHESTRESSGEAATEHAFILTCMKSYPAASLSSRWVEYDTIGQTFSAAQTHRMRKAC